MRRGNAVAVLAPRGVWGDNINWLRVPTDEQPIGRLAGWTTPTPRNGDELEQPMQSGRTGVYVLSKVEPCWDPGDMWFADATFKGYREGAAMGRKENG